MEIKDVHLFDVLSQREIDILAKTFFFRGNDPWDKIKIGDLYVSSLTEIFFVIFKSDQKCPQGFMPVLALQELMSRAEILINKQK